jgi:hypothetical protein
LFAVSVLTPRSLRSRDSDSKGQRNSAVSAATALVALVALLVACGGGGGGGANWTKAQERQFLRRATTNSPGISTGVSKRTARCDLRIAEKRFPDPTDFVLSGEDPSGNSKGSTREGTQYRIEVQRVCGGVRAISPLKPPRTPPARPGPPQPLAIHSDMVVDGGTYESITVDNGATVTIRNVTIDNASFGGNPLQVGADCLYVRHAVDVRLEDSTCRNAHRQGVAVTDDKLGTVTVDHVTFEGVHRYTWDLEPSVPTDRVKNFSITNTTATESKGWGLYHCGAFDTGSVYSQGNTYAGQTRPDGYRACGAY